MEVEIAAGYMGRRKFFIDLTNWSRVERKYRPFLANSGWPQGLITAVLDISNYLNELEQIYREAAATSMEKYERWTKSLWKIWFRIMVPVRVEAEVPTWEWEVKTHLENVLGRRFEHPRRIQTGKARLYVRDGVVHVGGLPSVGHTYLYLLGLIDLQ